MSDAATPALLAAASRAFVRNALSERDEYCETTIAVEVAATTANAAPSHQRTPMKRRVIAYRLRRDRTQGAHGFLERPRVLAGAAAADDDVDAVDLRDARHLGGRHADREQLCFARPRDVDRVRERRVGA